MTYHAGLLDFTLHFCHLVLHVVCIELCPFHHGDSCVGGFPTAVLPISALATATLVGRPSLPRRYFAYHRNFTSFLLLIYM